jgi:8-oxo-dGTP pyrophosphatase MutT (NUDIX family)
LQWAGGNDTLTATPPEPNGSPEERTPVPREPIPTWFFALVVVRHEGRFLLVHERKHGQLWYLPAGRAEFGESLPEAACREALEETGVAIRLTGLIRIEHSPMPGGARVRAVFLGEPTGDPRPKSSPDAESLGAAWVPMDELPNYPLRGQEVAEALRYVAAGGPVYPLEVLQPEGAPLTGDPSQASG